MDKKVAKLNIEHFQKKLAQESDPDVRARLKELIEEEERKLKTIFAREQEEQPRRG